MLEAQNDTYNILAQKVFSYFDSIKLVDWAVKLMENGYDSLSLIILAGLDKDSTEEREKYFWKAIEELKLDINKSEFDLIDHYAVHIAKSVIKKDITPEDGLSIMQKILFETKYSAKYLNFYFLDEDLYNLEKENTTIYNTGLTQENKNQFIIREFELFLEIEKLNIQSYIYESAYCNKCKSIGKSKLKQKRNWTGKVKAYYWVCGNCESQDIKSFTDQLGKELIVRKLTIHPE